MKPITRSESFDYESVTNCERCDAQVLDFQNLQICETCRRFVSTETECDCIAVVYCQSEWCICKDCVQTCNMDLKCEKCGVDLRIKLSREGVNLIYGDDNIVCSKIFTSHD